MMFFGSKTLSSIGIKLTDCDQLYVNKFSELSQLEKIESVWNLIDSLQYDFIATIATYNEDFRETCLLPHFNESWTCWWSSYGTILTGDKGKAFFDQNTGDKFLLFLGAWFYHRSQVIAKQLKKPCSKLEVALLDKAISLRSIHACQTYHRYLYEKMDTLKPNKKPVDESTHRLIIKQVKTLLPDHGTYAYLMLTEAFLRYGHHLNQQGRQDEAKKAIKAAMESCKNAREVYKEDDFNVYNASFGGTLADSNTWLISDFDQIEQIIKDMLAHVCTETEPAVLNPDFNFVAMSSSSTITRYF